MFYPQFLMASSFVHERINITAFVRIPARLVTEWKGLLCSSVMEKTGLRLHRHVNV